MAYAQIHVEAMSHWKIAGLSDAAFRLWVCGLVYAQTHLTDGLIDRRALVVVRSKARRTQVEALVNAGLWDTCDEGWRIHDYTEWNKTREEVEGKREKWRVSKRRVRKVSTVDSTVDSTESPATDTIRYETKRSDTDVRAPLPSRYVPTGRIVEAWLEAGRLALGVAPGNDVSAKDRERFTQMRQAGWSEDDIIAGLRAWWASPHITRGRHVSFFQSDAAEAIAHARAGHAYAFRDPKPPKPVAARSSWCEHTPECSTQAEHLRRTLDEERARQGISPREAVAS